MPDATRPLPPDIEIARAAKIQPITQIAEKLNIAEDDLEHYGRYKAKVSPALYERLADAPSGKLILVTAITPTPAGEGKTTTSIGLTDALARLGKRATVCLREPSLGPCFGMKGGAAGGGYSQVIPMEDINLHFTGDFHAIGLAHNLLAAMLDNHIHHSNSLGIDPRRIVWKRVLDMNDRALREIIVGPGRAEQLGPSRGRLRHHRGLRGDGLLLPLRVAGRTARAAGPDHRGLHPRPKPVTAADLKAHGAMTVLLEGRPEAEPGADPGGQPGLHPRRAVRQHRPRLQQRIATKLAMRLAEYTVTEAGFGADLGAEKFLNIKCRKAGIRPDAVVRRGHRAGVETARRRAAEGTRQAQRRGPRQGHRKPQEAHREHPPLRPAGGGGHQPLRHRHRPRRSSSSATSAPICP